MKERKKVKIESLKELKSAEVEEDPFESLGPHARVKSVAVGGVDARLLPQIKSRAAEIGKVRKVSLMP